MTLLLLTKAERAPKSESKRLLFLLKPLLADSASKRVSINDSEDSPCPFPYPSGWE